MDDDTEEVMVELPNGVILGVEMAEEGASNVGGALDKLDLKQVEGAIEGLSQVVIGAPRRVRPQRATVQLG